MYRAGVVIFKVYERMAMSSFADGLGKWLEEMDGMDAEGQKQSEKTISEIKGFVLPPMKALGIPDEILHALIPLLQRTWKSGFTGGALHVMGSFRKHVGPAIKGAKE